MTNEQDEDRSREAIVYYSEPTLNEPWAMVPWGILRSKTLTPEAKVIYALLVSYKGHSEKAFPGQARLAQDLNASLDTVQRRLRELKEAKLVKQHRRGLGRTNEYELLPIPAAFRYRTLRLLDAAPVRQELKGSELEGTSPSGPSERTSGGHRDPSDSMFQHWEREYADRPNKVSALVDCYRDLFGQNLGSEGAADRAVGSRIASLWREHKGEVLRAMFRAAGEDPKGDPIDYIARILARRPGAGDEEEYDVPDLSDDPDVLRAQIDTFQDRIAESVNGPLKRGLQQAIQDRRDKLGDVEAADSGWDDGSMAKGSA